MRRRKQQRMQPFEAELENGGVEYKPITFSCYGRPHPDALRVLGSFGRRLARRKGTESHVDVGLATPTFVAGAVPRSAAVLLIDVDRDFLANAEKQLPERNV